MRTILFRELTLAVTALTLLVSCGGDEAKEPETAKGAVQLSRDTKEVTPEGDNDVKIVSTDGVLVLAVISDSVIIQLSDSLRKSVGDSVQRETADKGSIGAIIGSAVGAAVNTAMGFKVRVPARAVENLRYENGELLFNVTGKGVNIRSDRKGNGKGDGSSTSARFAEEDAKRFIDAVKTAQARTNIQ